MKQDGDVRMVMISTKLNNITNSIQTNSCRQMKNHRKTKKKNIYRSIIHTLLLKGGADQLEKKQTKQNPRTNLNWRTLHSRLRAFLLICLLRKMSKAGGIRLEPSPSPSSSSSGMYWRLDVPRVLLKLYESDASWVSKKYCLAWWAGRTQFLMASFASPPSPPSEMALVDWNMFINSSMFTKGPWKEAGEGSWAIKVTTKGGYGNMPPGIKLLTKHDKTRLSFEQKGIQTAWTYLEMDLVWRALLEWDWACGIYYFLVWLDFCFLFSFGLFSKLVSSCRPPSLHIQFAWVLPRSKASNEKTCIGPRSMKFLWRFCLFFPLLEHVVSPRWPR